MTKRNCRKKTELLNIIWRLRIISFGCIVLLSTEVDAHQFPLVDTTSLKIDTIYIASEPDYPPFCFVDQSGKAAGFAIDLFLASAKAIGAKVVVKVGIWDVIKQDLANGRIDALPLVGRTPEREDIFDFTIPFLSLHGAVFVRRNSSGISSIQDLHGKEIVVMKGDNAEEFILREKITEKLFTTNTFEEAFKNLANGEHYALLTQRITGLKLLEEMKLKSVVPLDFSIPGFRQDFCFAVKQGDVNLLNQLNEGLSIVIANNVYDQIHAKWFGPVESGKIRLIDALKKAFLFFIMMVFIASLFFVFTLRRLVRVRTKRLNEEISEHKRLLKELETKQIQFTESETQIRLLLNSTAEGIYGIDLLGNCTFINKSALNMLGYESADVILGRNMHHLIHHTKADGTSCPIDECKIFQAFREGKGTHCEDELLWRKNGTSFPAEYFSYPIFDGDQITGSVVAFWDIGDRIKSRDELLKLKNRLEEIVAQRTMDLQEKIKKLNKSQKAMLFMVEDLNAITAELKEEQRKLELSNKELDAFTYSVSHDLRAPLRAINGYSKFLEEDYSESLDEEGKRFLLIIRQNATKMDHLIADMLSLSRITRVPLKKVEVDMNNIVQLELKELSNEYQTNDFNIEIMELIPIECDVSLIRQVWHNLIGNALKYSSKSEIKKIEIGSKVQNKEVLYFVRDFGIGFNMKYHHKLFGVFQRLHSEKDFEGTGVGLSIVQRIVNRHGGSVWAEGEPGKGATFTFSIPNSQR